MRDARQAARRLLDMEVPTTVRQAFQAEHGRELPAGIATYQELLQFLAENKITFSALDRGWGF